MKMPKIFLYCLVCFGFIAIVGYLMPNSVFT